MECGEKREPGYGSPGSFGLGLSSWSAWAWGKRCFLTGTACLERARKVGRVAAPVWCGSPGPAGRSPPGTVLGARAGRGAPEEEPGRCVTAALLGLLAGWHLEPFCRPVCVLRSRFLSECYLGCEQWVSRFCSVNLGSSGCAL